MLPSLSVGLVVFAAFLLGLRVGLAIAHRFPGPRTKR
jgi:hypothetical protein